MDSRLRNLVVHLLAATSVPLAVAAALAGLWVLFAHLALPSFAHALIRAAALAVGASTLAMYGLQLLQTLRTYGRGRVPPSAPSSPTPGFPTVHSPVSAPPPPTLVPGPPATLGRVALHHWEGVGIASTVFVLLLAVGLLAGWPAEGGDLDRLTYYGFRWLGHGALLLGTAILVFTLVLTTNHALRGVGRSFFWALNDMRPAERRPNLPFEWAVAVLPLFAVLLLRELR